MSAEKGTVLSVGHGFSWLLIFLSFCTSYGTETDNLCLRQVKEALEDPNGYLNNWDFNNKTEGSMCQFDGIECWNQGESRLLNIKLQDMGLKGQFPLGLVNCTTMTGLYLSGNNLTGPLPLNISKIITFVTELDLSDNHFSGPIPENLANCSYLNVLYLAHNRFNGSIPLQLGGLDRLHSFDVSYNNLSGQVPKFNFNISKDDYANNFGLCGYPLDNCTVPASKSNFKYTAAGIAGGLTLVIVLTGVAFIFISRMKVHKHNDPILGTEANTMKSEKAMKVSRFDKLVPKITLGDLMKATGSFSDNSIISSEVSGTMYKAKLRDGTLLMVKRLPVSKQPEQEFLTEITALGSLKHPNLVPLLGFCMTSNVRFLVYRYMKNGNLYNHLQPSGSEAEPSTLPWALRLKIAIKVATGLSWLEQNRIHGRVSSKCIWLDEGFEPKLCEFRLSKLSKPLSNTKFSTLARGEFGALGLLTPDYSNMHSFGTVLLELVTGGKLFQLANASGNFMGGLADWVHQLASPSTSSDRLHSVIDGYLLGKGVDNEVFEFLSIACRCVSPLPSERPTICQVLTLLTAIGERYNFNDVGDAAFVISE